MTRILARDATPRTTELVGSVAIRDVAATDTAPARRVIEGLAVPYGVVTLGADEYPAERFAAGSFARSVAAWLTRQDGARVPILDRHGRHGGVAVGAATELWETPEGLRFRGELLEGDAADAFAARIRAGVNGISAEFAPGAGTRRTRHPVGVEHVAAELLAIAGSHAPAYDGARAAMRSRADRGGSRPMDRCTIAGCGLDARPGHSTCTRHASTTLGYVDSLAERLTVQRERRDALSTIARTEDRELSDAELEELDSIDAAIRRLEPTLLRAREERSRRSVESTAAATAAGQAEPAARDASGARVTERSSIYTGVGEWLRDTAAARRSDRAATQRLERFAAERALADETTTNMAGLVPSSITGSLIAGFGTRRPLVDSMTAVPIGDSGMDVIRPTLTGGDVDEQATQKTQVTSTAMTAASLTTPLKTYAGGVDVAWQLIERSSPAALDALFRRLANRYARRTEIVAAAKFVADLAAGPAAIVTTAGLTGAKTIAALIGAAGAIAATDDVDQFPDTVWLSLTSWATMAGLVGTDGRPMFVPGSGISLGLGDSDQIRLRPVIVPRWAGANVVVGSSEYVERYELGGSPVQFRSIEAALLGTNISIAGLFAARVTNPAAFQRITLTA